MKVPVKRKGGYGVGIYEALIIRIGHRRYGKSQGPRSYCSKGEHR